MRWRDRVSRVLSQSRVIQLLTLGGMGVLVGCSATSEDLAVEDRGLVAADQAESSTRPSASQAIDVSTDSDPWSLLRYGWIAKIEIESVQHISDAPGLPYDKKWALFRLRVEGWLRIPDEEGQPTELAAIAYGAPWTAKLSAGNESILVCNPYNQEPDQLGANEILRMELESAQASGSPGVRSCGFIRAWFTKRSDGTYSVPWLSTDAGVSDAALRTLIGDSSPSIESLQISIPTSPPVETAIAASETSSAVMLGQIEARNERASATMQASYPAVTRAIMGATGPIDEQMAIQRSRELFPPGDSPTVAFAYRLKGTSAAKALQIGGGVTAVTSTWLVGLTRLGLTIADNQSVFGSYESLGAKPTASNVTPATIFGYYFLWNAASGQLVNSGTLSRGQYGDTMAPLLDLHSDLSSP